MTFLPILQRELRTRARRPGTYWSRAAIGVVAFMICLPVLLDVGGFGGPAELGRGLFSGMVGAGFLLSCAAFLLTINAVDSEARQGTLGLLILTRVKGPDLLLGKLGSAGIMAVLGILAIAPALMLPMLAGGVTGGETARKALTLLNTCFVALTAGLLLSVSWRRRREILGWSVVLLGAFALLPFLDVILRARGWVSNQMTMALVSPMVTLICAADSAYKVAPMQFWASLALSHAAGWGLLLIAGQRLQRALETDFDGGPSPSKSSDATLASSNRQPRTLALVDEQRPVAWLARRERGVKPALWTAAILSGAHQFLYPLLFARFVGTRAWGGAVYFMTIPTMVGSVLTASLVAWAASKFFAELRANGDLEFLTSTPGGARALVKGHWLALRKALWGPLAVMLLPHAIGLVQLIWSSPPMAGAGVGMKIYIVGSHILGPFITLCFTIAMCWLGQWLGLVARRRTAAILGAVTLVKVVPYMAAMVLQIGIQQLRVSFNMATFAIYLLPQAIFLIIPVLVIVFARQGVYIALTHGHGEAGVGQTLRMLVRNTLSGVHRARRWVPQEPASS